MALPACRSPYAGGFFEAALPESSPLPWPSRSLKRSAPACSPCGANMSTLQDSLDGTDYWVALPSQEDTALHHPQSPGSSGGLLRGSLAITTTGLPPVSHQDLSRRTNALLASGDRDSLRSHPRYDRTSNPKSWAMRAHHASSSCIAPKSIHASSDMPVRQARNGTACGPIG